MRACACVVCRWSFVACPRISRLELAAGVCVGAVGVRCGWSLATPGCGSWVPFPATACWGLLFVVVAGSSPFLAEGFGCSAPPLLAGVHRWGWWVVPRHPWPRAVVAVSRHSWLGSAGCAVGVRSPLLAEGPAACSRSSFPGQGLLVAVVWRCCARVLVCYVVIGGPCPSLWPRSVCVFCLAPRVGVGGVRGRFVCAGLAVCVCVCACGVWFFRYVIPCSVRVVGRHGHSKRQKSWSCRCVARGWPGGGRCGLYPCPPHFFGVCTLWLCFASRWYLRSVEVRSGVVLRVTVR